MIYYDDAPANLFDLEEILASVKESVLKYSEEFDVSSRDHAWICCAASMIQMAIDGLNHVGASE